MRKEKPILTKRMLEILAMHASGLTLKEVARKIFVSYSAVTNSVYDARKRTDTDTIAELVMKAHSLGYLSHPTGSPAQVLVLNPFENQL
jgi:DNA-binding NarL/FixJ family response regulator